MIEVAEVEIDSESKAQVVVCGNQHVKMGTTRQFHDSEADAYSYLLRQSERRMERLRKELERLNAIHTEIKVCAEGWVL